MSTARYYRTQAPEVMAQVDIHQKAVTALWEQGQNFAKHFGGKLITSHGLMSGYRISGVSFDTPKDTRYWTLPDFKMCRSQSVRTSLRKPTAEEREELKRLRKEYVDLFPVGSVSVENILGALGTSTSALAFTGVQLFAQGGWLYVKTRGKVADFAEEILGSVFAAAEAAKGEKEKEGV